SCSAWPIRPMCSNSRIWPSSAWRNGWPSTAFIRPEEHAMRDLSTDHELLSLNTATVRKQWRLDTLIDECARRDIRAICPWRDQVAAVGLEAVARQLRDTGTRLSGYCRGGFFPAADAAGLAVALEDNRRAVDEARTLDAPCLVLVVGALPGALQGQPAYTDIARARGEV